ncbi:hypothetical protein NDU88_002590 [Pleurodeles waltl]|uniref:Uncharacterized protein n=1 Tax=Pleurodeles waltl TaxID=8319 RepID=A0AAV7T427_PLEWA|nr:hypothetical protein NDU88_002590 [Pleurodeles waltl]
MLGPGRGRGSGSGTAAQQTRGDNVRKPRPLGVRLSMRQGARGIGPGRGRPRWGESHMLGGRVLQGRGCQE